MKADVVLYKAIIEEVEIDAPVKEVWQRWTKEEGIKSFLADECEVGLRIGGPFEIYFLKDGEPGKRGSEGCRFLSYLPYRMLSFSWNAPPQYPNVRGQLTWVVLEFSKRNENATHLRLTHLGWKEGEEWEQVYNYFDSAWGKVLKWLKESFEKA